MTWRYHDSIDEFGSAERSIRNYLGRLRILEAEYAVAKASRIAKNMKKADYAESARMREIKRIIRNARAVQKAHNRYNYNNPISIFEEVIARDENYVESKKILDTYHDYLLKLQESREAKKRGVMYKNSDIATMSESEIEIQRQKVLDNYEKYKQKHVEEPSTLVSTLKNILGTKADNEVIQDTESDIQNNDSEIILTSDFDADAPDDFSNVSFKVIKKEDIKP